MPTGLSYRIIVALVFCLGTSLVPPAQAQGLLSLAQSKSASSDQEQTPSGDRSLEQSLDVVIKTLENDAQRQELLTQLKSMRQDAEAIDNAQPTSPESRSSLLDTLTDSLRQTGQVDALVTVWVQRTSQALKAAKKLADDAGQAQTTQNLMLSAWGLGGSLALIFLLGVVGRKLFRQSDGPFKPSSPKQAARLFGQFLHRVFPWIISFAVTFWLMWAFAAPAAVQAMVLTTLYIALCGRAFSAVFEVVISLFMDGHRRRAALILRRNAIKPLFAIAAFAALGDATDGGRLRVMLGEDLAHWIAAVANLLAAVVAAWLVVRVRRPVAHVIRNRDYAQRHDQSTTSDLIGLFARIWHIPALLAIGSSILAVLATGTGAGEVLSKAVLCAVLLLTTLTVNALFFRQRKQLLSRRFRTDYRKRLMRFGLTLTGLLIWGLFFDVVLWVWGYSLLGIGSQSGVSPLIGQALLGVSLTAMLAWLTWIFADIAIGRALRSTSRREGRLSTRAQTATPMVRNAVFFTIVIIAAIAGLANLGVNVTPLLAGAGVIGLAVGFGAQTLVRDLITGLFILIEDSIAVGDFIQVGAYMGTVEGLNLRTVRMRDLDGIVHFITFSHIDSIHNMSREYGTALLKIRIPHNMQVDDAISLMQETAKELRLDPKVRSLIRSPLEMQGIDRFDEGCPILRMQMRTAPEYQWLVGRAFNLLLKRHMEKQAITLGAPRLSVTVDGRGRSPEGESSDGLDDTAAPS